MKKLLLVGLVLFGTVSQARSIIRNYPLQASLNNFSFQPNTDLASAQIYAGIVAIDLRNNEIELSLYPEFRCPPGVFCAQMMPAPVQFKVSLKSTTIGTCGETIYSGEDDATVRAGSPLVQIEVVDNSTNTCESLIFRDPTIVRLIIDRPTNRRVLLESHGMSGSKLETLF